MKRLISAVASLTLSAAGLATAKMNDADVLGHFAQPSAAHRAVVITEKTKWITVERGEVVRFESKGQEFAWTFDGVASTFALSKVAPTGALDRDLIVYVWPNAQDLADK
jgi:hypothetical protein